MSRRVEDRLHERVEVGDGLTQTLVVGGGRAVEDGTHSAVRQAGTGGDLPDADFDAFLAALADAYPWLPADLARRYARAYGTRIECLLNGAGSLKDLGEHLGDGLYEAEADYLVRHEWARTEEDILWRRSKLGLHLQPATVAALRDALGEGGASGRDIGSGAFPAAQAGRGRP